MSAKSLVSALLVALLAGGIYYLTDHAPHRRGGPATQVKAVTPTANPFHGSTVAPSDVPMPQSPCAACHKRAPHGANRRLAAFLNLHSRALDCTGCHAQGVFTLSRDQATGFIFAFAGGVPVKPPLLEGRTHSLGQGLTFALRPQPCGECHRRGSRLLATPGLYDEYRRRLLEDLDVLPAVEESR